MINPDMTDHHIFPFHDALERFNRNVFSMSNHDYDLDEITAAVLNALVVWDEIEDNRQVFIERYGSVGGNTLRELDIADGKLLSHAVEQYFDDVRKLIDFFDSRTSDGILLYTRFTIDMVGKTITYHLR